MKRNELTRSVKLHLYPKAVKEFCDLARKNPNITIESELVTGSAFYKLIEGKEVIQAKLIEFQPAELLLFSLIIGNSPTVSKLNMLTTELGKYAVVFANNIATAPALEVVYLGQTGIKGYVIPTLRSLSQAPVLKYVDISFNGITDSAKKTIAEQLFRSPLKPTITIHGLPPLDKMITLRDQELWEREVKGLVTGRLIEQLSGIVGEYILSTPEAQYEDSGSWGEWFKGLLGCCFSPVEGE